MPHKRYSKTGMAVSIFDHLVFEQRKLLATRTVRNNGRVNAPET